MTETHFGRVKRAAYETHLNITEITVMVTGEQDIARGDFISITTKESNK